MFALFWGLYRAQEGIQKKMNELEQSRLLFVQWGLEKEFVFISPATLKQIVRTCIILGLLLSLLQHSWLPIVLALTTAWFLPVAIFRLFQRHRRKRFEKQLPALLPSLAGTLRAGHSLERALEIVAKTQSPPLSQELGIVLKEVQLGHGMGQALVNMEKRLPNRDLAMVVRAICISARVGSNLAETMDQVSSTIMARTTLRNRINALTSQGKAQAWIAMTMPVGLSVSLIFVAPDLYRPFFLSDLGKVACLVCLLLLSLGGVWIYKISHAEVMK